MSSKSNENSNSNVKIEIKKTLISINDTARKIKNELDTINGLIGKSGQFDTAITNANKTLITAAENMNINLESILNDNQVNNETTSDLRNVLSASTFQEKILQCLNNI